METLGVVASCAEAYREERTKRDELAQFAHEQETTLAAFVSEELTGRIPAGAPGSRVVVPAGSGASAVTAFGLPIGDAKGLDAELVQASKRLNSRNADGYERVATITWRRPASHTIGDHTPDQAEAILAAAAAEKVTEVTRWLDDTPDALVAAGTGWGAPRQPLYDPAGHEVGNRPVVNSLPSLTATRGGFRFYRSPELSDLDGATSTWTVQNDIDAATDPAIRKPSIRVGLPPEVVVDLEALATIVTTGNMLARAWPEHVRRVNQLSLTHHSVALEQRALMTIGALSTAVTGGVGSDLGASRTLLTVLETAAAAVRWRGRMGDTAPLAVILPSFAKSLLKVDIAKASGVESLAVTDAQIGQWLRVRRLAITWSLDVEAGHGFAPQTGATLVDFPGFLTAYVFPVGAFTYLDGGVLDLGVVRDSVLNAANDYQTQTETFWAVARRGNPAYRLTCPVDPSGVSRAAA